MTFKDYYNELPKPTKRPAPKTEFINKVMDICRVSEQTVRMWLQGTRGPSAIYRKIISEYLNIPEKELFPGDNDE